MSITITPAAQAILAANRDWMPSDNPFYMDDKVIYRTLFLDAVHFGDDADLLAGAFNEFYGFVSIEQAMNPKSLAQLSQDFEEDCSEEPVHHPESVQRLLSSLTASGWLEFGREGGSNFERYCQENERVIMSQEKPYHVHLYGTDDVSYSKAVATLDDAKQLLKDLHQYGFSAVHEQMFFTN